MKKFITMFLVVICIFTTVIPVNAAENIFAPGWHKPRGEPGSPGSGWYYIYSDGSYANTGWQLIGGKWYYFRDNGGTAVTQVGFIRRNSNDNNEYYCDNNTGALITNDWVIVSYHNGVTRAWAGANGAIDYTNTKKD